MKKNVEIRQKGVHNYHILAWNKNMFHMYQSTIIPIHCTIYKKNLSMHLCAIIKTISNLMGETSITAIFCDRKKSVLDESSSPWYFITMLGFN